MRKGKQVSHRPISIQRGAGTFKAACMCGWTGEPRLSTFVGTALKLCNIDIREHIESEERTDKINRGVPTHV